jgi:DNA-directed RNA polymerase subunit omega
VPERAVSMMEPPIEVLLDQVDSRFTLVTLAAKRGRQINSYYNQLGEGLGTIVPPQVDFVSRKPLSIAFEEIAAGKVRFRRPEPGASGAENALSETDLSEVGLSEVGLEEDAGAEESAPAEAGSVVDVGPGEDGPDGEGA